MRGTSFSMSATKCIERSRREHEDLLAEFNSLMSGVEATLQATGMKIERLTHDDMFLEVKTSTQSSGQRCPAISSSGGVPGLRKRAKPDGEREHRGRTR